MFGKDYLRMHAVHGRPCPVTFAVEVGEFLIRRHTPVAAPMDVRGVMRRREDVVRRDPALPFQGGNALIVCRGIARTEREIG